MAVDENNMVIDFVEKPADPPPMPGRPEASLASMGIYIFNAAYLWDALKRDLDNPDSQHDFGKDIIPAAVREGQAAAHPFELSAVGARVHEEPYWRDVGTIDAFWDANIDLTATVPMLNLYDTHWPIWTYQSQLPPAKFVHNAATGAASPSSRWSRGAASSPGTSFAVSCSRACGCIRIRVSAGRSCCLACRSADARG